MVIVVIGIMIEFIGVGFGYWVVVGYDDVVVFVIVLMICFCWIKGIC